MLSLVKMLLKAEVGGHALNSHGNYIVDRGKSWKNHGIVFLNFPGNLYYPLLLLIFYLSYRKPVQNHPIEVRFPVQCNKGLWGGEGIVEGMVKKMYFGTRYVIISHKMQNTKAK